MQIPQLMPTFVLALTPTLPLCLSLSVSSGTPFPFLPPGPALMTDCSLNHVASLFIFARKIMKLFSTNRASRVAHIIRFALNSFTLPFAECSFFPYFVCQRIWTGGGGELENWRKKKNFVRLSALSL